MAYQPPASSYRDRVLGMERLPAACLRPHPMNWRTHPDQQKKAMVGVLGEIGWADALVVRALPSPDGGYTHEILDGHLRAYLGGDAVVPCVVVDLADDEALKFLATHDPLAGLAIADAEALRAIEDVVTFEDAELAGLLASLTAAADAAAGAAEGQTDPDDVPEPAAEPYVKPGDLWLLGEHRLLCGDATNAEDVARLLDGTTLGVLFSDPPYGVSLIRPERLGSGTVGGAKPFGTVGGRNPIAATYYAPIVGDDQPFDPRPFLDAAPVTALFGGNYFANLLPESPGWIVWDKREKDMERNTFADCEMVWTNLDRPARIVRHLWMGLMKGSERSDKRVHPAQKPVELIEAILADIAPEGDVYDPFVGSGTTIMAAERQRRRCYAMEISPAYVQVCIERWQAYTGRTVEKAS